MSRCKACDVILNEYELKRIDNHTGMHLDLCNVCASHSDDAISESSEMAVILKDFPDLSEKELDSILNA
jgi:protein-arginine kinase activator protein McsA